ncbi:MAG: AFG1/ZapE family ATPase [Gammaproteobacteria bacterium]
MCADKRRCHFHRLMSRIKHRLAELRDTQDPLLVIATEFARETRVICFDEFFVSDIADAMLLGHFLEALLARGVVLVATSNTAPPGPLPRRSTASAIHAGHRSAGAPHRSGAC